MLAGILLLAFALRAWNLDWDRGTHLQPDERFWSSVAASVENPEGWDWGQSLTPWSWNLDNVSNPETSTLNPRSYERIPNYVYGTLPLWASEAAAGVLMTDNMAWAVATIDGVGIDVARDAPPEVPMRDRLRFNTGFDVTIIGRLMSAIVDTMTVGVVFLLARELTDKSSVGLLAALLQTFTVLHIQYSHFLGSEPWVAFFVTCSVWGSVRLARGRKGFGIDFPWKRRPKNTWSLRVFTAVSVGFAIASKLNGVASIAGPVVAALVVLGPDIPQLFRARIAPGVVGRVGRKIEPYLVMLLVAIFAYRIAQPYDFESGLSLVFNERFRDDITYLSDINSGGNWPWVQPLVGRTRLLHPLWQMFMWGMGPALGLAAIFGLGRATRRFMLGERYWAVPLSVIASYFVLVSFQFYAIIRYLQPSYPIITSLTAAGLVAAWNSADAMTAVRARLATAIKIAVGLAIGLTAFWALAFVNGVYNNTNARLAAGDWMIDNLETGAVLSVQEWDDPVPWGGVPQVDGRPIFEFETFRPFSFGGDTPEGIELLIQSLDRVDYVVESSNKFYDSLPRTPARFPQMTQYYDTLFDGSLGFELVETFQNQPSLFGITIDDAGAEEAFTLYDHPTVLIWQKTDNFSVERAYALLNPDRARTAINAVPKDAGANAGMLRPDEYVIQQTGSSFADVHSFDPSSPVAALLWFGLLQVLSLTIAPSLMLASGRAAGAVYGLAKPLVMILFSLPIWLLVSFGIVNMSRGLVWFAFALMLAFGAWRISMSRAKIREMWQANRGTIIAAEMVFASVFLFVLWLRADNPDMWHPGRGGEKPMELAYLTAVTGSTTLPPYDPWLAGGSINYYYMGFFVLAVPIRLLGLAPDVGFNLGVATYAALAAVTVFSTAAMLAELARRRTSRLLPPAQTGLLAVLLFLVIGNLDGFRQLVSTLAPEGGYTDLAIARVVGTVLAAVGLGLLAWNFARQKVGRSSAAGGGIAAGLLLFLVANLGGARRVWRELPWSSFDWWDPSRVNKDVIGETCGDPGGLLDPCGFEVTEFPSFTVLFADLHPHFMAMPFFGLGLAGAIAFIERARQGRTGATWLLAIGLGLGSGFIRMVHTWDLPTFVLFVAGAIVLGWVLARGPVLWRVQSAVGQLVAAGAAHMLVTAPYRGRNQVGDSGFHIAESRTYTDDWFVHWGVFLFIAVTYLGFRLWSIRGAIRNELFIVLSGALVTVVFGLLQVAGRVVTSDWPQRLLSQFGWVAALALIGTTIATMLLVAEVSSQRRSTPHVFVAACWILGFAVLLGVELFTQNADIARLNTVFKFWLQVWHLFAVAGAFGVSWIVGDMFRAREIAPVVEAETAEPDTTLLARIFAGGLVFLLLAALVYPVMAIKPRQDVRVDTALGLSLDGQLWLEPGRYQFGIRDVNGVDYQIDPGEDRAIIDWLQANVEGRPTIVEGVGGAEYQWWGRISINTGLPTVLGWRWHQSQQRTIFDFEVNERKADVAEFYTTDSVVVINSFLRAYDVSYVIVGSAESAVANPRTLELFAEHSSLIRVLGNDRLAIYEVDKNALAQASRAPGLVVGAG